MKRIIFLFAIFITSISTVAFADEAQEAYDVAKTCYKNVKIDIHKVNDPKQWHKCIALFKNVSEKFPKSSKAPAGLYSAARMHRELYVRNKNINEVKEAIHLYNAVIIEYPDSNLADDSLYQIGLLREDPLKENKKARRAFETVIERYPQGDMAPKAQTALKTLGEDTAVVETDVEAIDEKPVAVKEKPKKEKKGFFSRDNESFKISKLVSYEVENKKDQTVVILNMDGQASFTRKFVDYGPRTKSPAKLTLHFSRTKMEEGVPKEETFKSPYLNSINIKEGVFTGELKIRFELGRGVTYKVKQEGKRTIIQFYPEGNAPAVPKESSNVAKTKKTANRKLRIVIDPGHGGDDTGAIGPGGIKEKDVTLNIAKQAARLLEKKLSAKVYLTRTRDVNLPLEKRNAFANAKKADVFISIHANAVRDRKISGIETYYLNNATDEAAKRLAKRENKSAARPQNEVDQILLTLFQNYNTVESQILAKDVHAAMMERLSKNYPNVKNRRVRSALFYLLVGAKCPGILMEVAYISNSTEEKRLKSNAYQSQVAYAVAEGVTRFAKNNRELALNTDL